MNFSTMTLNFDSTSKFLRMEKMNQDCRSHFRMTAMLSGAYIDFLHDKIAEVEESLYVLRVAHFPANVALFSQGMMDFPPGHVPCWLYCLATSIDKFEWRARIVYGRNFCGRIFFFMEGTYYGGCQLTKEKATLCLQTTVRIWCTNVYVGVSKGSQSYTFLCVFALGVILGLFFS